MATIDRYKIEMDTRQATTAMGGLRTAVKAFIAVVAVDKIVDFGKAIVNATKQFQTYENQLRLITNGSADLNRVMGLLQQSAIASRTSFADFLDLFVKLRVTTDALGISEERVIGVTEKLSQALQVAGADAATANAVIRQFGQAMASGEVRGDEFRSIVEGLGPALAIMARESGLNVGELRRMSREGELSAKVMFELFEASNALTAAFESQTTTLSQLETAYGDALDRALVKFGESSFVGKAYQEVLESLTRTLDKYAETSGALVNLSIPDIMKGVADGIITAEKALAEFQARLAEAKTAGFFPVLVETDEIKALNELIEKTEELAKKQKEAAEAKQEEYRIEKENQAKLVTLINQQVQGLDAITKKADAYSKLEFGTPFEKATRKLEEAKKVLVELTKAQEVVTENAKLNESGTKDFTDQIEAAQKAVAGFQAEVDRLDPETFVDFYKDLIDDSKEAVQELDFTKQALKRLKDELDTGSISLDVYNAGLKILGEELEKVDKKTKEINSSVGDFNTGLLESIEDSQAELDGLNMSALDREIAGIERRFGRDLKKQIDELKALQNLTNKAQIDKAIQEVTEASQKAQQQQIELAETIYETQRTFEHGWKKAFESYVDDATDASKHAEQIFTTATKGMEDALVDFAKTGKFEFRGLVADILETLLRSQIQQLIGSIFSMGQSQNVIGQIGSVFGGFFANGGTLGGGKFGIAGENGPELITGPAQITPLTDLGGNQTVTYNINAVDASSFKTLVARDPQFIHAVATQGARKVPVRR